MPSISPPGPDEPQPAGQPLALPPRPPGTIDWAQGMRASALAGLLLALAIFLVSLVVGGVGTALHLGQGRIGLMMLLAGWACMLAAGALAVRLYRRRHPEADVSTGMGARLGVVSGLLGFFFFSIPRAVRLVLLPSGSVVWETVQKAIEQAAAQSPDPQAREMMRNFMSPGALAAILTFLVVLFLLVFLVFSTLGGAIGASVWGKKQSS